MRLIDYVSWPQRFNMTIDIDEDEFLAAHSVFEVTGELCHRLIIWKYDELHLIVLKVEIVRDAPLSLVCVVDGLSTKLLGVLIRLGAIRGPEGRNEGLHMIVPLLFFLFIADFTGYDSVLSRRLLPLYFAIPVATVALVWTNPVHGLMWTDPVHITTGGVVTLDQTFGPWFWVYFVYAYSLLVVGFVLLLRLVAVSEYLYFDQSVLIVVGILAPLAGNAARVFGLTPLPGLDLTPYGFAVTGVAFGNALFRYRLFDLLPATRQLGRQAALAALDDGVVIVDTDREVLYMNAAAAEILGRDPTGALGESADPFAERADQVEAHFDRFWDAERGHLCDVIDGPDGDDPSLRPNQIFAVSLPNSPLSAARQESVVDTCAAHL